MGETAEQVRDVSMAQDSAGDQMTNMIQLNGQNQDNVAQGEEDIKSLDQRAKAMTHNREEENALFE